MSNNSNKITPDFNVYSETINSIIKSSIPIIDTSIYINPLIESAKVSLNILTESINLSIQPLIDHMNEINSEIATSINSVISNIALESLNNLKIMSNYSSDIIESIDKSIFDNTIDEVYTSVDSLESYTGSPDDLDEYKNSFLDLKQNIKNSSLTKEDFHFFIGLLISLFTIIQPYLDNSSEILIEQQKQIIEFQKQQLNLSENISDISENSNDSLSDISITLKNINKSLENIIESVED